MSSALKQVDNRIKGFGVSVRRVTSVFARFRAELLSVMFFGFAVTAMFQRMLNPAFQLVGLFDLWSSTLGVLFLPVALQLLDIFLPIMDFFMNLSEPMQMAIGVFALLGLGIGKILTVFAVLNLAFPGLLAVLGGFFSSIGALFTLPFLATALVLIIGFVAAWKTNFLGIRDSFKLTIDGIKDILGGLWDFIKGFLKFMTSVFTGDIDGAIEGVKEMFRGLKRFLIGILENIGGTAGMIVAVVLRTITGIIDTIIGGLNKILKFFGSDLKIPTFGDKGNVTTNNININAPTNVTGSSAQSFNEDRIVSRVTDSVTKGLKATSR